MVCILNSTFFNFRNKAETLWGCFCLSCTLRSLVPASTAHASLYIRSLFAVNRLRVTTVCSTSEVFSHGKVRLLDTRLSWSGNIRRKYRACFDVIHFPCYCVIYIYIYIYIFTNNQNHFVLQYFWLVVIRSIMGVKLGRWHYGRKRSWGCLRTWCWGEYLDRGGNGGNGGGCITRS
jgi:hypothetical protein